MTASPAREVNTNLLRGAAPGSAQARAHAQDAGRQDLGDLVEALGRGHQVGVESVRHALSLSRFSLDICYLLAAGRNRRGAWSRAEQNKLDIQIESQYRPQPQCNGLGKACILGDWIGSPPEPSRPVLQLISSRSSR
jgi:hypothetical protein